MLSTRAVALSGPTWQPRERSVQREGGINERPATGLPSPVTAPEQAPRTACGLSRRQQEAQPDCACAAPSIAGRKPARRAVRSRAPVSVLPGGHDACVVGDESLAVVDSVGAVVPTSRCVFRGAESVALTRRVPELARPAARPDCWCREDRPASRPSARRLRWEYRAQLAFVGRHSRSCSERLLPVETTLPSAESSAAPRASAAGESVRRRLGARGMAPVLAASLETAADGRLQLPSRD